MNKYNNEKIISTNAKPIPVTNLMNVLKNEKSICKIKNKNTWGTGFFFRQNVPKIKYYNKYFLITNNHVLNSEFLNNNNELIIYYKKKEKIISLNGRIKITNEELDYTLIEFFKDDKIENFLNVDKNILTKSESNYINEDIYILQYIDEFSYGQGKIKDISKYKIKHTASTCPGASGSPILILIDSKIYVIGVHKAGASKKENDYNIGIFMKNILNDINNQFNDNKDNAKKKEKNKKEINENNDIKGNCFTNYIICEHLFTKINDFQILNCYEQAKEDYNNIGFDNENEIKENCKLFLNDKEINFCFKYKPEKIGKHNFKIICNTSLKNLNYMFYDCNSLQFLDLSNFNTSNANNMIEMFSSCNSLAFIDLSNINTINVTNMSYMFSDCSSLTSLNLSDFDTKNVTDMSGMFSDCSSLTSLNLSNFNTNNVTDMSGMYGGCSSLTTLNLSNFNTNNVKDMSCMFLCCSSLTSLNLSNFNTNNVTDMGKMFDGCSSLTSLNLSHFNTNNVTNMNSMFYNCSSLTTLYLSNFNTNNVTNMREMFFGCSSLMYLDISNFNLNKEIPMNFIFKNINAHCCIISNDTQKIQKLQSQSTID